MAQCPHSGCNATLLNYENPTRTLCPREHEHDKPLNTGKPGTRSPKATRNGRKGRRS